MRTWHFEKMRWARSLYLSRRCCQSISYAPLPAKSEPLRCAGAPPEAGSGPPAPESGNRGWSKGRSGSSHSRLREIQLNVYRGRLTRDRAYIDVITHEISSILSLPSPPDKFTLYDVGRVIRFFAFGQPYSQNFFDSVAEILETRKDENLLKMLLPTFLWVCAKCQHYPRSLMMHAGDYLLQNIGSFTSMEVNMMVHAFAVFNHRIPGLIAAVERWFLENEALDDFQNHLPMTLAWASMVFSDYPAKILTAILNDKYIEGCMQCRRDFLSIILLQLKISLNKDPHCPADLRLGLGWDSDSDIRRWGRCRAAIEGLSENIIRKSYLEKLHSYHTLKRSVFGSNLHRAIRTTLGSSTLVQSDAISLTGYNFDFEVLLDRSGDPIPFPLLWKYRARENLASSIGFESAAAAVIAKRAQLRTVSDKLVQSMRQSEEGSTTPTTIASATATARSSGTIDASALPRHGEHKVPFHLASDWGRKFCELPRPAARKLIIEGDGLYHFARNDRHHQLGHTVLKRKHAEMLGWEIINVDYKVWQEIQYGDAQADYIKSLIYHQKRPPST